MKKFVVLSTQRSGSTFLGTCLGSHPDIQSYGEIFQYFRVERPDDLNPPIRYQVSYQKYIEESFLRKLADRFWQKGLIHRYLDQTYSKFEDKEAVGFKLMYSQAAKRPDIVDWLKKNNVKVVHLIRKNHLKTVVSLELAKKRGIYASTQPLETTKIFLDPDSLQAQLNNRKELIEAHRSLFKENPYLEIEYEAFVKSRQMETSRLLAFLEVKESQKLTSELAKSNSNSLRDLIENYEEVAHQLRGSRFESFLS